MYYVPDGTKTCGYYEWKKCGNRFLSLQTMEKIPCPDCEAEVDYEIGPGESLEDVLDTAVLLQKIEGEEEVEKMDALLSLAITGGDFDWIWYTGVFFKQAPDRWRIFDESKVWRSLWIFTEFCRSFSAILKENKEISKVHEKNIQKQPKKYRWNCAKLTEMMQKTGNHRKNLRIDKKQEFR